MSIPSFHPSLHTRVEGDQSKGALIPQGYIQAANINSSTNIYMKLRSTNENLFHKKRVNFQYDKDNRGYVMGRLEPNMLVQSTNEHWKNGKIRMMQEDRGTGASREPLAVSSMLTSGDQRSN